MMPVKPDPLGILDILAGAMLLFTASPLPETVAEIHAIFLIFKGVTTCIRAIRLPLPFYPIGNAADIMSAAILLVGQPPILVEYKTVIAGSLAVKGGWGLLFWLS